MFCPNAPGFDPEPPGQEPLESGRFMPARFPTSIPKSVYA